MAISATVKENTFGVGDVVRVHQLVSDDKMDEKGSRTQIFEGTVIGIRGSEEGKNFIVRRIGEQKIGIEMIFPFGSPALEKVEVVRSGKRGVARAKLYYTRNKSTREIEKIYTRAKHRGQAQPKPVKKVVKKASKAVQKNTSKKK